MKKLMMLNLVVVTVFAVSGATRIWTGGGDGLKWSDPQNWDVGNANLIWSDEVVFDSGSSGNPLVTSNDLGTAESPVDVGKIVCQGTGMVTLKGTRLNLRGISNIVFTNSCPATCALDINLPEDGWKQPQWHCVKILKQTGTITMSSSGWIRLYTYVDDCMFAGDINCPLAQIRAETNKKLYLDGKLTAASFNEPNGGGTTYSGTVYYRHPSNEVVQVGLPMINIVVGAVDALGTNAVVSQGWRNSNNSKLTLYADQTIDRFGTPYYAALEDNHHVVVGAAPSKLTMKATADCISDSQFNNSLTLVWDPQGDYNFTAVTNHAHTINGGIVVKRGTFSVVGTTTKMENLTFVKVADDAIFAMDVSSELALKYLATVDLGERARFEYGPSMRCPNVAKYPVFRMADGAKVKIPAGVAITGCVFRAGAYVGVGTYTGSDNATPGGATPIGWIEGEGTFTTANDYYYDYWVGGDGSWTDTDKWSSGFPNSANREARIWARGDMTLTLTGEVQKPLYARNFAEGLTELAVGSAVSRTGSTTLEGSVRMTVGNGGVLTHNSSDVTIRHGAELRVAGGTVDFSNYAKTFRIGYEWSYTPTRVLVESGSFAMSGSSSGTLVLDKYGRIEMTGGAMTVTGLPLRMVDTTSAIALSGNARMTLGSGVGTLSVTGEVAMADAALLSTVGDCDVSGAKASLKFTVGERVSPKMTVGGTLKAGTGNVIEVDATEWLAARRTASSAVVLKWNSLDGSFDDIKVTPVAAKKWLVMRGNELLFRRPSFTISVR